ncbi:glycosyltransferase [Candidatus Saccharibacteria bacterium]|nr:glycosyltransferase [Candidatus Saccharibacteria bacterium]
MNIAIFTDLYLEVAGGIPSSIRAQKEELKKRGHKVTIFCPGNASDDSDVVLVPTSRLKINGAPMGKSPEKIESFVIEQFPIFTQFDLVHVHYEAEVSIAGLKLARRFKVPVVQTMHGREDMAIGINVPHPFKTLTAAILNWLHARYIPHKVVVKSDDKLAPTVARAKMWTLMVNHANFADIVLTPSKHFAKKLKTYGVTRPIEVVSNGVADSLTEKNWPVRKLKPGETLNLIWNSRVSKEKRIMPFLEALKLANIPVKMEVFGGGNQIKRAEKYVKKHNLTEKVEFHGQVPHERIIQSMKTQHLSITVSYGFDTQGLTLLEAEATGLPVFFCDPDMKEIVPAGGSICARGPSATEMAQNLRTLYEHPEKIKEMSLCMLEHRHEVLQSVQIEKLLKVYNRLTEY